MTTSLNDEAKVRVLDSMAVARDSLRDQIDALAALDDEAYSTGRYDLRDQLVTMRRLLADFDDCGRRARSIVPVIYWVRPSDITHIPKVLKNSAEYAVALARIDELMDAKAGSAEGVELSALATLVEVYELKAFPFGGPRGPDAKPKVTN